MNPLDEILDAAGIPPEHPRRTLAQRDGYNVVGDRPSTHVYLPEHPLINGVGFGTGPCQYPGCTAPWLAHSVTHGALDVGLRKPPRGVTVDPLTIIDDLPAPDRWHDMAVWDPEGIIGQFWQSRGS